MISRTKGETTPLKELDPALPSVLMIKYRNTLVIKFGKKLSR